MPGGTGVSELAGEQHLASALLGCLAEADQPEQVACGVHRAAVDIQGPPDAGDGGELFAAVAMDVDVSRRGRGQLRQRELIADPGTDEGAGVDGRRPGERREPPSLLGEHRRRGGGHGPRIQAAAQFGADLPAGPQPDADGLVEVRPERLHVVSPARQAKLGHVFHPPVQAGPALPGRQGEPVGRGEPAYRPAAGPLAVIGGPGNQVLRQVELVELWRYASQGQQCLRGSSEGEDPGIGVVVEGRGPELITSQEQPAIAGMPRGQTPVTQQVPGGPVAEAAVRGQDEVAVAGACRVVPADTELADQLVAVVEPGRGGEREALPAVHHRHRLQAPLRSGETPGLPESRAALRPLAEPIAAEVPKPAGHGAEPAAANVSAVSRDDTVNRAHRQRYQRSTAPAPLTIASRANGYLDVK